jgi:hypothetical protein
MVNVLGHRLVPCWRPTDGVGTKSRGAPGDGELNMAEGEESWLGIMLDSGEASLDPSVVRRFIVCVREYCYGVIIVSIS